MTEVGAPYTTRLVVTNGSGNAADATTVTLTVTRPDQVDDILTLADGTVTRDGLGLYHVDYTPSMEGLYRFTWSTTGVVKVQTDFMNATAFRSIIGVDEAKNYIGDTDSTRDDIMRLVLSALTEKAESIAGSCVQKRYVNETVSGYEAQVIRLPHAPLPSETAVESVQSAYPGGPGWTAEDFIVYPESATVELISMLPFWRGPWKVTYTAGRLVIPPRIQLAVKEMLFDFWANQRPYGADALEPSMDETTRWEQALNSYDVPPHARALLDVEAQPGFA